MPESLESGGGNNTNYGAVPAADKEWKWHATIVAAIGQMCCWVCGIPAVLYAIYSYIDHQRGDYPMFLKRKKYAMRIGILAIICGIIYIFAIWVTIGTLAAKANEALRIVRELRAYLG